ncbi:MAG: VTT domain-containing protein [Armatimonadetes bacterium]|nr:VTT domain-containing protein [Armatimonadota bacterium]
MSALESSLNQWIAQYGYHAVPFAVLSDPAGVPWAWIFLMLLAEEAGKNVPLMLFYGFGVLMAFDHLLYWIGALGGSRLVNRVCANRPKWAQNFEAARDTIHRHGALSIIFGRYLPFVGRWMGLGAGLAKLNYAKFSIYDAIGSGLSAFGFGLVAHFVGRKTIEHPQFYNVVVILMVGLTLAGVAGIAISWWRGRKTVSS